MEQNADALIVGGGPAGYAAALYAARSGLTTLVLASERLFMASAVMAMLPKMVPTRNLPAKSSTLQKMHTKQARLP